MTIILTNDDGIDAPGIAALFKAVNGKSVIIAAPQSHQSGCGHQVTTHQPINLQRRSDCEYAIGGTPADCIRVATPVTATSRSRSSILSTLFQTFTC